MLRDERKKQEISAAKLAAKLGISRSTITHIDNDRTRPTLWVLLKIADGLGMKLSECLAQVEAQGGVKKPR
jgi:transcriptional regulator with XRE-family HTH domain